MVFKIYCHHFVRLKPIIVIIEINFSIITMNAHMRESFVCGGADGNSTQVKVWNSSSTHLLSSPNFNSELAAIRYRYMSKCSLLRSSKHLLLSGDLFGCLQSYQRSYKSPDFCAETFLAVISNSFSLAAYHQIRNGIVSSKHDWITLRDEIRFWLHRCFYWNWKLNIESEKKDYWAEEKMEMNSKKAFQVVSNWMNWKFFHFFILLSYVAWSRRS